jgi:ribosomal protein S18 acetylase RimI-like enzyme
MPGGYDVPMFRIMPCRRDDLGVVHKLSAEYASFDATPTFADTEGLYERNPEYFYVATESSGEIIGFITGYERKGVPDKVLRTWKASRVGYIDLMAVDLAHRREGIGTSLLNTLLKHFQNDGIDMVILDVPAEQVAAVKLYEKLGFHVRAFNMRKDLREERL